MVRACSNAASSSQTRILLPASPAPLASGDRRGAGGGHGVGPAGTPRVRRAGRDDADGRCRGAGPVRHDLGDPDHHGATATRGVLDVELSADRLHEAPGHGQAEADPDAVVRVAEALEGLEDPIAVGSRDPRTAVDDPDVHPTGHPPGFDAETRSSGVEQCVVDQVGHGPFQEHRVGADAGDGAGMSTTTDSARGPRLSTAASISRRCRCSGRARPSPRSGAGSCPAGSPPGCSAGRTRRRWSAAGCGSPRGRR